jgi:hypothetical protein
MTSWARRRQAELIELGRQAEKAPALREAKNLNFYAAIGRGVCNTAIAVFRLFILGSIGYTLLSLFGFFERSCPKP